MAVESILIISHASSSNRPTYKAGTVTLIVSVRTAMAGS